MAGMQPSMKNRDRITYLRNLKCLKIQKIALNNPWQFVGLFSLFDLPRHDSAETIHRALYLGVNVKMITGDQITIAKETGRRLGMGPSMYPSSSLLCGHKDALIATLPIKELIEKANESKVKDLGLKEHTENADKLCWEPEHSDLIATASGYKNVRLWDVRT